MPSRAAPISKVERHVSDRFCAVLWYTCEQLTIRPVAEANREL